MATPGKCQNSRACVVTAIVKSQTTHFHHRPRILKKSCPARIRFTRCRPPGSRPTQYRQPIRASSLLGQKSCMHLSCRRCETFSRTSTSLNQCGEPLIVRRHLARILRTVSRRSIWYHSSGLSQGRHFLRVCSATFRAVAYSPAELPHDLTQEQVSRRLQALGRSIHGRSPQ
jgi:hypothetical protein